MFVLLLTQKTVASWLVKRLLELGFDVHATVRDPRDPRRTGHLNAIAQGCPGTLTFFKADLLDSGGFDRPMEDCGLVFHTASPLIVLEFAIVDVRDVAEGHLRAGLIPEAEGRHILVSESLGLVEIARVLRDHFGDGFPFPRRTVANTVALMLAPRRGIPQAVAKRNLGYPLRFSNRRAREALGMTFRPAAESVVEHFQQLLDDGLVVGVGRGRSVSASTPPRPGSRG